MLTVIKKTLHLLTIMSVLSYSLSLFAAQGVGYYAGLGIGGMTEQFQINSTTTIQPSNSFFYQQSNNPKISGTNVLGSFMAGRLFAMQYLDLGPEIYLNLGRTSANWNDTTTLLFPTETLTTNSQTQLNMLEAGIDARIGSFFNSEHLFYGRLGLSVNKLSNNITAVDARPLTTLSAAVNNSLSKFCYGFRAGAGFEQAITSKIFLRGDYIFTYYPNISQSATGSAQGQTPGFQLGPVENITSVQTNTQLILLSLVYYWNSDHV